MTCGPSPHHHRIGRFANISSSLDRILQQVLDFLAGNEDIKIALKGGNQFKLFGIVRQRFAIAFGIVNCSDRCLLNHDWLLGWLSLAILTHDRAILQQDLELKRSIYAIAMVPKYWVVDLQNLSRTARWRLSIAILLQKGQFS